MDIRKALAVGIVGACSLWAAAAGAVSVNVNIDGDGHHSWVWPEGPRTGTHSDPGVWNFGWNIDSDADPFIQINSLSFTNTSTATQHFVVTLSGPVSPSFNPANVIDAEMGYTWTSDGNTSITGISWQGTLNGSTVSTIFGSSVNYSGIPLSGTVATTSDPAVPFVHNAGGPITAMGMIFDFYLSSGDTLNFNARLEITPVPVPPSLVLLATGLVGMIGIARRR